MSSKLDKLRQDHLELAAALIECNKNLYSLDLLVVATLNRSLNLLRGFRLLMESGNYEAASPLVRLQMDNAIRFYASYIVEDPHDFTAKVLGGTDVRKLTDRDGNNMTDKYLVDKLGAIYPWLPAAYREACGFVHLSNQHFITSFKLDINDFTFELKVADLDAFVPDDAYDGLMEFFGLTSEILFTYIAAWIRTKAMLGPDRPGTLRYNPEDGTHKLVT